jgi:hypothetical protein
MKTTKKTPEESVFRPKLEPNTSQIQDKTALSQLAWWVCYEKDATLRRAY